MTTVRMVWISGRFSWVLIGAIVFATISVITFDLVWRLVKVPFHTLFIGGIVIDAVLAVAVVTICLLARRRRRTRGLTHG